MPDSQAAAVHQPTHGHAHDPALLHHFAEPQQQRDAASLGMWWFLATEVMFFGGLFCAYLIYRLMYFPEFGAASKTLDVKLGATNTAVLICSSLTVVLAVWAAQTGRRMMLVGNLALTLVLGLVFLGIKGVEYHEKFVSHHVPGPSFHFEGPEAAHAQLFFSLYFVMTAGIGSVMGGVWGAVVGQTLAAMIRRGHLVKPRRRAVLASGLLSRGVVPEDFHDQSGTSLSGPALRLVLLLFQSPPQRRQKNCL